MKVIKVVYEARGKLVSSFAMDTWRKEYAKGVETKPDVGYLFAYSSKDIKKARVDFSTGCQFWLADAEVVGRLAKDSISVATSTWYSFWRSYKPQLKVPEARYLLCSSITLTKRIEVQ